MDISSRESMYDAQALIRKVVSEMLETVLKNLSLADEPGKYIVTIQMGCEIKGEN